MPRERSPSCGRVNTQRPDSRSGAQVPLVKTAGLEIAPLRRAAILLQDPLHGGEFFSLDQTSSSVVSPGRDGGAVRVCHSKLSQLVTAAAPCCTLVLDGIQEAALGSSRTEKPADTAAFARLRSPQIKVLLEGRCSHQIKDAASCRLSAARKTCPSSNCIANSRTWSPGRISLQPRLSNLTRATAPSFSTSVSCRSRWRRQIALYTSTKLPHQTTGANFRK